jgi:hypothetical protein
VNDKPPPTRADAKTPIIRYNQHEMSQTRRAIGIIQQARACFLDSQTVRFFRGSRK